MPPRQHTVPAGLRARLESLYPGAELVEVQALRPDDGSGEANKELGYGEPLRLRLRLPGGTERSLVFHVEADDDHGHDRRADRAANVLLAWDSFGQVPHHARAVDVGGLTPQGQLVPLREVGELYLLTEWAEGGVYAEDLRRIAESGAATALDTARLDGLVEVMLELHACPGTRPPAYTRALRDLVGSGEGIAGIVDSYGEGVPAAPPERLDAIEHACLDWRHRLKRHTARLRRTHGDLHPFNIVFPPGGATPTLLDTSRGSQGDPADDVTCLSLNFLFFGLEHGTHWATGLGALWRRFWERYLAAGDPGVLEVAAPFFAWRVLVLCNPTWYPKLESAHRERLLGFAERVLEASRFDPAWGEEAMR